jgi:hypothetical protein
VTLPPLGLQILYAHLAWAMVLGAAGVGVLWRIRPFSTRAAAVWLLFSFVVCLLPDRASVAYWLGLAMQMPSAFLLSLCVLAVWNRGQARPEDRILPTGLAIGLVLAGAVLYADSWGWIHLGLYVRGFGPEAARAGLLIGLAAVVAVVGGLPRRASLAAMASLVLFAVWRLPTGNIWDALLDPLLWGWAIFSLVARWRTRRRDRRRQAAAASSPSA